MQSQNFLYHLGTVVEDQVTGMKGTITSQTAYLNGCKQYGIKPRIGKDEKYPDTRFLDEEQLKPLKEKGVNVEPKPTGGPQATPGEMKSNF